MSARYDDDSYRRVLSELHPGDEVDFDLRHAWVSHCHDGAWVQVWMLVTDEQMEGVEHEQSGETSENAGEAGTDDEADEAEGRAAGAEVHRDLAGHALPSMQLSDVQPEEAGGQAGELEGADAGGLAEKVERQAKVIREMRAYLNMLRTNLRYDGVAIEALMKMAAEAQDDVNMGEGV